MKTLTAVYDLEVGPVSFDFVVFLVKAELHRQQRSYDKLHVAIVPFPQGVGNMFRDKRKFYDEHEAHWRLWNICIPACALVDASVTLATDWVQASRIPTGSAVWPPDWDSQTLRNRPHLVGSLIAAAHEKIPVPQLCASTHARRKVAERYKNRPFVTMTQRRTYLGDRNTDVDEWRKARDHIKSKGYAVETIYDVDSALGMGSGFAEFSIDLRMALYQEAALNLQANNGAASLCWFSATPYRMFDAGVGDTREEWRGLFEDQGLPWGEAWPWAKTQQKIVYERSTADVIIREFEEWAGAMS